MKIITFDVDITPPVGTCIAGYGIHDETWEIHDPLKMNALLMDDGSEQIRDVVTVDNPFEPGTKIERPAFFNKSWINSRQDMMILSDKSLEPNTIRGLMEQGEWLPAN